MQLADQTKGKGKIPEPADAMFEGENVVSDFSEVGGTPVYGSAGLGGQQFTERHLRPFDLAREDRLAAEERTKQEMGVGEAPTLPGQSSDRAIGVGKASNEVCAPTEIRWQRIRNVGRVAFRTSDPATGRPGFLGGLFRFANSGHSYYRNIAISIISCRALKVKF